MLANSLLGLAYSHVGWILCAQYTPTDWGRIKDFAKYPELAFFSKYRGAYLIPPVILGAVVFLLGGASALVVSFALSTVCLYHSTFTINSLSHIWGSRRYATEGEDTSTNNFLLALITLGEGWHNNHHYYQLSVRQGFFWWEIDITYYILKVLSWVRIVWDLKVPPKKLLHANLLKEQPVVPAE